MDLDSIMASVVVLMVLKVVTVEVMVTACLHLHYYHLID